MYKALVSNDINVKYNARFVCVKFLTCINYSTMFLVQNNTDCTKSRSLSMHTHISDIKPLQLQL